MRTSIIKRFLLNVIHFVFTVYDQEVPEVFNDMFNEVDITEDSYLTDEMKKGIMDTIEGQVMALNNVDFESAQIYAQNLVRKSYSEENLLYYLCLHAGRCVFGRLDAASLMGQFELIMGMFIDKVLTSQFTNESWRRMDAAAVEASRDAEIRRENEKKRIRFCSGSSPEKSGEPLSKKQKTDLPSETTPGDKSESSHSDVEMEKRSELSQSGDETSAFKKPGLDQIKDGGDQKDTDKSSKLEQVSSSGDNKTEEPVAIQQDDRNGSSQLQRVTGESKFLQRAYENPEAFLREYKKILANVELLKKDVAAHKEYLEERIRQQKLGKSGKNEMKVGESSTQQSKVEDRCSEQLNVGDRSIEHSKVEVPETPPTEYAENTRRVETAEVGVQVKNIETPAKEKESVIQEAEKEVKKSSETSENKQESSLVGKSLIVIASEDDMDVVQSEVSSRNVSEETSPENPKEGDAAQEDEKKVEQMSTSSDSESNSSLAGKSEKSESKDGSLKSVKTETTAAKESKSKHSIEKVEGGSVQDAEKEADKMSTSSDNESVSSLGAKPKKRKVTDEGMEIEVSAAKRESKEDKCTDKVNPVPEAEKEADKMSEGSDTDTDTTTTG